MRGGMWGGIAVALLAGPAAFAADGDDARMDFPVIAAYGGVFPTKAVEGPRKGTKVVFDVTGDGKVAGMVVPGLERVALLYNLAGHAGLKPEDIRVAVVFHGAATKTALNDEAYTELVKVNNPNALLIERLKNAGAVFYVCGQSMAKEGYDPKAVRGDVTVAASALTTVINKQTYGYVYVSSH